MAAALATSVDSLALLQNRLKRSPEAYETEFTQQCSAFEAQLAIYALNFPLVSSNASVAGSVGKGKDNASREFGKLISFLSHTSNLYPDNEYSKNFPEQVLTLFTRQNVGNMSPELRMTVFQALVLMRNKNQIEQITLIEICFEMFNVQDKNLRQHAFEYVVQDVKRANLMSNQVKLNNALFKLVAKYLCLANTNDTGKEKNPVSELTNASLKGLQIVIELYKKRVLTGEKVVNTIARALLLDSNSENTKFRSASQATAAGKLIRLTVGFFLGIDEEIDSLEADEEEALNSEKMAAAGGKAGKKGEKIDNLLKLKTIQKGHSKRTRARLRIEEKNKKTLQKLKAKMNGHLPENGNNYPGKNKIQPRFAAIELLNDPQDIAEALFARVQKNVDVFDVRLNMLNLISRLLGFNQLIMLQFFTFMRRYIKPHQNNVTQVLSYFIQSLHELVPPEAILAEVKLVANNFVNDKTDSETMAVGLNSIREIIHRVPLLTEHEGFDDLIEDLVQYKSYKKSKSVVMAARGLLNLIREINPSILRGKDRGKDHDIEAKPLDFGQKKVLKGVEGIEFLKSKHPEANSESEQKPIKADEVDFLSNEDFAKIKRRREHAAEEAREAKRQKKMDDRKVELEFKNNLVKSLEQKRSQGGGFNDPGEEFTDSELSEDEENDNEDEEDDDDEEIDEEMELESDEDEVEEVTNGRDSTIGTGSTTVPIEESESEEESDEDYDPNAEENINATLGVVNPHSLEGHVRQKRRDLAERLETVYAGRAESKKFTNKNTRTAGTSNSEKEKGKNFQMVKQSIRVRSKQTHSLKQQQHHLKKHIKSLEKNKKTIQKITRKRRK